MTTAQAAKNAECTNESVDTRDLILGTAHVCGDAHVSGSAFVDGNNAWEDKVPAHVVFEEYAKIVLGSAFTGGDAFVGETAVII